MLHRDPSNLGMPTSPLNLKLTLAAAAAWEGEGSAVESKGH